MVAAVPRMRICVFALLFFLTRASAACFKEASWSEARVSVAPQVREKATQAMRSCGRETEKMRERFEVYFSAFVSFVLSCFYRNRLTAVATLAAEHTPSTPSVAGPRAAPPPSA